MFSYKKFEELCMEKNVTVYRVAQKTGVSTATLTSWKQGKYVPKVEKLMKLADYFNVPVTYFSKEGSEKQEISEMRIFNNAEFGSIRTVEENGQIWFCGKDIAVALNYTNPKKAIADHCREGGVTIRSLIDSMGRIQQAKFINEPNLYRLITHSKLPNAEKFERWVFEEVLPAIRKTGHYEVPGYAPKATSVGEVVNLIKVTRQTMKEQGASPTEIATAVKEICEQFGVNLPQCFVKPKETTLQDVYGMIDFIFSQPTGRGHKAPTYEDFIVYQAGIKRIGGNDEKDHNSLD